MLIDRVKGAVNTVMQKQNRGFVDPKSYDNAIAYVQGKILASLFVEYNKQRVRASRGWLNKNWFDSESKLKAALSKLYKAEALALNTGGTLFEYPSDYDFEDILTYKNKEVSEATIQEYTNSRQIGMLTDLDAEFITYIKDSEGIITTPMLVPADILTTPLEIFYFRIPVTPVWGYTLDADANPVFEASTSVDLDLNDSYFDEIVRQALIFLGVEVKDFSLVQSMQSEEMAQNRDSNAIQ